MTISENEAKAWFLKVCRFINEDFVLDDDNKYLVNKMFQYCFRMPEFEEDGYSLNKGFLIIGPYGTGKTDLMKILQTAFRVIESPLKFGMKPTLEVAESFISDGPEVFKSFSGMHFFFDDIGVDNKENVGHYANKTNIANDIILHRYEQFKNRQVLTHFTSNKAWKSKRQDPSVELDTLESYLDGRAFSRLQEMCNVFALTGDDRRRNAKPKEVIPADVKPEPNEQEKKEAIERLLENAKEAFTKGTNTDHFPIRTIYDMLEERGMIVTDEEYEKIYSTEAVRYRKELEMKDRSDINTAREISKIIQALDGGTCSEVEWRTKKVIIQNYFTENQ